MIITEFCTGCRACEQLCPKHCITLKCDKEGFWVAKINENTCINCGLCQKRCPQNNTPKKNQPIKVLAVRCKNDKVLKNSSSGGAFFTIAYNVLQENGVVFGAAYQEDWSVTHVAVHTKEELFKLQGSKYVQSDTLNTFLEVQTLLNNNKKVLFSGTPCQIGGLQNFLKKDYNNLITIDLICHGVPSPLLFKKYICWKNKQIGDKILRYNFRDKSNGWGLNYRYETKAKIKTKTANLDPYYYHFLKGNTYRECCYQCHYCTKERTGDITIGDYWGIEQEHPSFHSSKGVSVMLLNTEKATKWFKRIEEQFFIQESTFEQASRHNHNLLFPTKRTSIRDVVYTHLNDLNPNIYFKQILYIPNRKAKILKAMIPNKIKSRLKAMVQWLK